MADDAVELVPAARMTACIEGVLGALGVPVPDAEVVAQALVEADLTGVDSHGIHLLSMYVERLRGGQIRPVTEITVLAQDHPRLLSVIAGACAGAGANIVDAQVFTTSDGRALDTILINREFDLDEDERRRAERVGKPGALGNKFGEDIGVIERAVAHIGPQIVVALDSAPQVGGVMILQLLKAAVAPFDRCRAGLFRRRRLDLEADRLAGSRQRL